MASIEKFKSQKDFNTFLGVEDNYASVSFVDKDLQHDYLYYSVGNKKLLVLLPASLRAGHKKLPYYFRWSWMDTFEGFDGLCMSDPTLHFADDLYGGWLQGHHDRYVIEIFCDHVKQLCDVRGYEEVIFSGSSLGGFSSLHCGTLFSTMFSGRVYSYAENAQIDLFRYVNSQMAVMSRVCYGVSNIKLVPYKYHYRLNVIEHMKRLNTVPKGLVVIKESDAHHYNVQLPYLRKELLNDNLKIEVISKVVDNSGHAALNYDDMKERIFTLSET